MQNGLKQGAAQKQKADWWLAQVLQGWGGEAAGNEEWRVGPTELWGKNPGDFIRYWGRKEGGVTMPRFWDQETERIMVLERTNLLPCSSPGRWPSSNRRPCYWMPSVLIFRKFCTQWIRLRLAFCPPNFALMSKYRVRIVLISHASLSDTWKQLLGPS